MGEIIRRWMMCPRRKGRYRGVQGNGRFGRWREGGLRNRGDRCVLLVFLCQETYDDYHFEDLGFSVRRAADDLVC